MEILGIHPNILLPGYSQLLDLGLVERQIRRVQNTRGCIRYDHPASGIC